MKTIPYIVAALVVWAVVQVVVLNVCVSLINGRIENAHDRLEGFDKEVDRYCTEVNRDLVLFNDRLDRIEKNQFRQAEQIGNMSAMIPPPPPTPYPEDEPEIFPEPNDPENCR